MEFWIINPFFSIICGIVAYKKQRNVIGWMLCGIILSWIALIILIFLPKLGEPSQNKIKERRLSRLFQNIIDKIKRHRELKQIRKPKFGRKPKVIFRPPEEIFTYEKNAFQVLGILPKQATVRTITKREAELTNLIKAGLSFKDHIAGYCAVPWPESKPVNEMDISNAHSRLQDNLKRIKEELFWFRIDGETDRACQCLIEGDFEGGVNLWDSARGSNSQYAAAQALHNLTVLRHAIVLNQGKTLTGNPGMNSTQIDNWRQVFELWKGIQLNDKCWDYLQERVVYLDDHRIHVERLRKTLPYMVLKINLAIANAALRQELLEYSKQHMSLIKNSGFDPKDIAKIERDFFNYFMRELKMIKQQLEDHPKNIERADLYKKFESCVENIRNLSTDSAKNDAAKKAMAVKDEIIKLSPEAIMQYIPHIKKVKEVKKMVDYFDGCSHIKTELEEIMSIPDKQIKKDFNVAIDRFISVRDEVSNYANYLIGEWNKVVNNIYASGAKREIKGLFEENARKLRNVRDARSGCADIAKKGKEMFKLMEDLCCDEERGKQIKDDIEWLDKQNRDIGDAVSRLENWINNNLNTLRQSY